MPWGAHGGTSSVMGALIVIATEFALWMSSCRVAPDVAYNASMCLMQHMMLISQSISTVEIKDNNGRTELPCFDMTVLTHDPQPFHGGGGGTGSGPVAATLLNTTSKQVKMGCNLQQNVAQAQTTLRRHDSAPVHPYNRLTNMATCILDHLEKAMLALLRGVGMTPGCIAVCSWQRLLASRHSPLPFP